MENSILSSLHALWLRMHNIFAREFAKIRPEWRSNDRILYEESKKILSALHQHYTYTEWLPILIGRKMTEQYVGDNNAFSRYNPTVK
jgi:peroxidase